MKAATFILAIAMDDLSGLNISLLYRNWWCM